MLNYVAIRLEYDVLDKFLKTLKLNLFFSTIVRQNRSTPIIRIYGAMNICFDRSVRNNFFRVPIQMPVNFFIRIDQTWLYTARL